MPPKSRRQRAYEEQLRSVRMRNRIAGFIGLLALASTIYFIIFLVPQPKPTIFLSLGYVNHLGTREVPFARESCDLINRTFQEQVLCTVCRNQEVEIQEIKGSGSELNVSADIGTDDTFIVYFNGHLVADQTQPGEETVDGGARWIGPESGLVVENPFDSVLKTINESRADLKILLLDAGRYSWSPNFPGRQPNRFATQLAAQLEQNGLGLDDNFWVVVSHSDLELSHASTPLWQGLSLRICANLAIARLNDERRTEVLRDAKRGAKQMRKLKSKAFQVIAKAYEMVVDIHSARHIESREIPSIITALQNDGMQLHATALQVHLDLLNGESSQSSTGCQTLRELGCRVPERILDVLFPLPHFSDVGTIGKPSNA